MFDQEEFTQKVNAVFESVGDKIYQSRNKQLMEKMHKCALKCYDEPNSTRYSSAACVSRCQAPVMQANEIVDSCIKEYQTILSNCLSRALDSTRYEKLSEAEVGRQFKTSSEACLLEFTKLQNKVVESCFSKLDQIKL